MATKKTTRTKKTTTKARGGKARTTAKKSATTPRVAPKSAKAPAVKKARTKAPAAKNARRTGLLDAAAAVLAKASGPMSCPEMVEAVLKAGTWATSGKTPAATLSAAIGREIRTKGKEARFVKAERGRFRLAARGGGAGRRGRGRKSA